MHDDFADEVAAQLHQVQAVLVWCNPIQDGRRRDQLDAVLHQVAQAGIFVSAHPQAIQRLGTKVVLFETRDLPFGSAVVRIDSLAHLAAELPQRLRSGARVLKQHRGHMIDQAWQPLLAEGMVRAHLVEDRVAGFGHLAINALHPKAAQAGPRLYHSADGPDFESLRHPLESHWRATESGCCASAWAWHRAVAAAVRLRLHAGADPVQRSAAFRAVRNQRQ